jgi:prepilin-type N-terminal cleavage/methylation domain-containing protein
MSADATQPQGAAILPSRGSRAFTLMEVLLAVLIFSIVLAAIQSVFFAGLRLQRSTTAAIEATVPLERTLEVVKRDLANIVMPGTGVFSGPLQSSPTMSSSASGMSGGFGSLGTGMEFGTFNNSGSMLGSGPIFYTASAPINRWSPWGELQKVSYYLAPPTNDSPGMDLIRVSVRNQLPVADEEYYEQYLMSGVEEIAFQYFDGLQWMDYWDSTSVTNYSSISTNPLPRAIKFLVQLAAPDNSRSMFAPVELVVPLTLQVVSNQTASAESTGGGG